MHTPHLSNIFVLNEAGLVVAQQHIDTVLSDTTRSNYSVSGLPAGNYNVFAEAFINGTRRVSGGYAGFVTVGPGQDVTGIDIRLSAALPEPPSGPGNEGAMVSLKLSRPDAQELSDALYGVKAGQKVLVWVEVEGAVDLAGYEIRLGFDPSQVGFQRMEKSRQIEARNILFQAGGRALFISNPPEDGEVLFSGAMLGDDPEVWVSGDGLLGVFRFVALEDLTEAEFRVTRALFQRGPAQERVSVEASALVSSAGGPVVADIAGPVKVDLDPAEGNQNEKRKEGVRAGDVVTLELFAEGFSDVTGYGMFIHYDVTQVDFVGHALNADLIPGAFERVLDADGRVSVAMASLGGEQTSQESGLLGSLEFRVQETFADSTDFILNTVTLNLAGGTTRQLDQQTVIRLVGAGFCGPDFNCDGAVNFQDFVLFAQAYGSTNPQFDLDGDGEVNFPDFLSFARAFGR